MKRTLNDAGDSYVSKPRRPTILVVEDDDDQWFLTRWAILNVMPDVNFFRTSTLLETLSYLSACTYGTRQLPALILLDLYLPAREEGWEVLESIKLHHTFRRVPVVVMSYSTSREDIEQTYYLRGASYLVKPTSYPDWLACFNDFRRYWLDSVTLPTQR